MVFLIRPSIRPIHGGGGGGAGERRARARRRRRRRRLTDSAAGRRRVRNVRPPAQASAVAHAGQPAEGGASSCPVELWRIVADGCI